ncbi:MAG: hypothetical protein ACYTBS_14495 [Planctomycetota bacterium]
MSKRPPKVALPGQMYQKKGRWWWKVRLPGEPRLRERALKPEGARFGAKTRKVAEEAAFEMWRLALGTEGEARGRAELKAESERKIARARAECREKIAASESALAEAERKLEVETNLRVEAEEVARSGAEALERVAERARRETRLRVEAEQRASMEAQARALAEARLRAGSKLRAEDEWRVDRETYASSEVVTAPARIADGNGRTARCEGCGRGGVPEKGLSRIESGQLICSDCMMVARA